MQQLVGAGNTKKATTFKKMYYASLINNEPVKNNINYVDIKKSDMKSLTYDQLLLFLKNIDRKKNGGRLDLLKTFLKDKDIPFKEGLWDWRS